MAEQNNQILLETKDLQKHFPIKDFFGRKKQAVKAVDGITFQIRKGETFGLVGESGCGKSTLGRTLIRMYEPTGGQIIFDGEDITKLEGAKLQPYHKRMQIIFQDPYSALDPHHNVEEIIREPMSLYTNASKSDIDEQIVELLKKVGMKADDMYKYAYEFSGGQRQRIGIARALAVKPEFLLCDEPISALDVSIQVQIMTLLERLQEQHGISYLFISHDLNMVRYISHRMVVMYLGAVMEEGPALDLYEFPQHPYTRALTALNGPVIPHAPIGAPLKGDPPNPLNPPKGCLFSGRCPEAEGRCFTERPPLRDWADRRIACWHI